MNARIAQSLPALGSTVEGGIFHGILLLEGRIWGEVSAPKAEGDIAGAWLPTYKDVPAAAHDFDGRANTRAMAEAGSEIAIAAMAARIGGLDDWYIPARAGQLAQWSARELFPEAERLERAAYWSSTQFSRGNAFHQDFDDGFTYFDRQVLVWRAREVRLQISH
jgi:hypothetical protein